MSTTVAKPLDRWHAHAVVANDFHYVAVQVFKTSYTIVSLPLTLK